MAVPPRRPPRASPPDDPSPEGFRCKRCGKELGQEDRGVQKGRREFCFWCAYVESQG